MKESVKKDTKKSAKETVKKSAKERAKEKPQYCYIIGDLMNKANESQDKLAAAIGVNRDRVNNWLNGRSKLDIENLIKIADHYGKTTDYLLGKTTVEIENATMRSIVECTGLSPRTIATIANATGRIDRIRTELGNDYYSFFHKCNPWLRDDAAEALDELVSISDCAFLSALAEIKRLCYNTIDEWEEWEAWIANADDAVDPPLSLQEAEQRYKDLRFALFTISEEAIASAQSLYPYKKSLDRIQEVRKYWYTKDAPGDTRKDGLEGRED